VDAPGADGEGEYDQQAKMDHGVQLEVWERLQF